MLKPIGPKPILFPMPGLLVATYREDGSPNAMTAAWTGACCHSPVCVGVAVRQSRQTYDNIKRTQSFTLAVPRSSQSTEVDFLGIVSGNADPEKMTRAGLTTTPGTVVNAPLILECPVNVECKLLHEVFLGTHTYFIGEVMETHIESAFLSDEGDIDIEKLDPLVYLTGVSEYRQIGPMVGKAFCDGKKLKEVK